MSGCDASRINKSPGSRRITGAIFDCDGTLIDSLEAWRGIEGFLLDEARVSVTSAERALFATFTIPEIATYFHEHYGLYAHAQAVIERIDEFMLAYYREKATLMPGVAQFLESCARNDVRMSVASSSPAAYLEAGLTCVGIRDYFVSVVSVDDVGASKREPVVFDKARCDMGTDITTTWGFEDSQYAMDTLRKAGYGVVGLYDELQGVSVAEIAQYADIVLASFGNLSVVCGCLVECAGHNE